MDTGDVLRTDRASRQPGSGPRIARGKPGLLGTDLARDYDDTDPDAVRRFVEDFLIERVSVATHPPG